MKDIIKIIFETKKIFKSNRAQFTTIVKIILTIAAGSVFIWMVMKIIEKSV